MTGKALMEITDKHEDLGTMLGTNLPKLVVPFEQQEDQTDLRISKLSATSEVPLEVIEDVADQTDSLAAQSDVFQNKSEQPEPQDDSRLTLPTPDRSSPIIQDRLNNLFKTTDSKPRMPQERRNMNQPALRTVPFNPSQQIADIEKLQEKTEDMLSLESIVVAVNNAEEKITNTFSRNTKYSGDLTTPDGMIVDGILVGDIKIIQTEADSSYKTGTVLVSESGRVKGNIVGKRVVVAGQVDGNITSATQLILTPTAVVNGELNYNQLIILQGATHQGCNRKLSEEEIIDLLKLEELSDD